MSSVRNLAITLMLVGVSLAIVSSLADRIGAGAATATFGWKQLLGLVLGVTVLAAGVVLLRQAYEPYEGEDAGEGDGEDEDPPR